MKQNYLKSFCARFLTLLVLALMSTNLAWGEDTWTRVTTIKELTDGGTFIMGYEATAKSGVIVPLRNADCDAKTTANGYFHTGTTTGSSTNGTIDMSKVTETADYEVYITSPASGKINIQMKNDKGSFYGATSGGGSKNSGRLYTSGNSAETNLTPEFSSETNNQFKLTSDVTGQYKYLKYNTGSPRFAYYDSAGSNIVFYKKQESAKTLQSIAVKTAPTKTDYMEGDYFDPAGLVITATYDTGDPEDIAYAGNESKFTFSPALETALTTSNTSVTITYGGKSVDQTITVNTRPAFTVTLGDNSETLTEDAGGAGVTLPSRESSNKDYTFAGWSITNIESETEDAPTIIPAGTYYPSANITLYPVFARTEEISGFSKYEKVTTAPDDWSGQYLLSTGKVTATGKIDNKHLLRDNYYDFSKEATSREFTLTKVGDVGYSIKVGDSYIGWSSGTSFDTKAEAPTNTETGYLWTPSTEKISNVAESKRTIADNGSSDFRPYSEPTSNIVYLYKRIEGGSKTYYTSSPAAITVKAPTFTPADGTKFATALDVTIECETDDATIKYSTDNGETWSDYSEAINITETTTIQAKAVKETVESSVVEATYTQLAGILSMKENGDGTYKLTDAVVTYITGENAFIQDATSGAYLYGCKGGLAVGDVINGDVTVSTTEYKGLFEISTFNTENATIANDPTKVVPTIVTITDLNANYGRYEGVYVKIEGATVTSAFSSKSATIEQNEASITLYDQFGLSLAADATAVVDVTGFLSKYNNVQFWTKEITVKSAGKKTSTIKFTKANGSYCVDDIEEFAATAYDENDAARTDEYTISYESSDQSVAKVENGHIYAYKVGTVTITASTPATAVYTAAKAEYTITILPKGTIWFEDFTGMKTDDVKEKYVVSTGKDDKAAIHNETISGGTAPEILLKGKLTVDLKNKAEAGVYKLTFNSNNGATISAEGANVTKAEETDKLWTAFVVVTNPTIFTLSFTCSSNSRLDNFLLVYDHAIQNKEVTITTAKWATLGLPYAVTIPEGVSAYTATVSETTVTMTKINKAEGGSNVIPANCGVILYADVNEATTYTFTEAANVAPIEGNQLVAALEEYTCTGEDVGKVYYLGKDGEKATFKKLNENGTIAVGKAYLKLTEKLAEGAKLDVTFDEATGINTIDNGQLTIDNSKAYNLNGVRVNENYKGIIIVNGKKYINK